MLLKQKIIYKQNKFGRFLSSNSECTEERFGTILRLLKTKEGILRIVNWVNSPWEGKLFETRIFATKILDLVCGGIMIVKFVLLLFDRGKSDIEIQTSDIIHWFYTSF